MIYTGYCSTVTVGGGPFVNQRYKLGEEDAARILKDEDYEEAIEDVKNGANPNDWGLHGPCVFLERLQYLRYQTFFRLPISHNLLLGLVKGFTRQLLRWKQGGAIDTQSSSPIALDVSVVKKIKKALDEAGAFTVTADFNRPFCGLKSMGQWTCEDWLRWIEIYSCFIREDIIGVIIPSPMAEMWHCLRNATLHYLHGTSESDFDASVRSAARENMLRYAQLLEEHGVYNLLTSNLHRANCWAVIQEEQQGLLAFNNELYGERGLRKPKNESNAKSLPAVDKTFCNIHMREMALRRMESNALQCTSRRRGSGQLTGGLSAASMDVFRVEQECGLQGRGRLLGRSAEDMELFDKIIQSTRDGLKYTGLADEWEFSDLEVTAAESHGLQIWLHDRAFIHQTQTIHSTSYTRNQTRDSTMLQVRYDEVHGEKKYVGVCTVR